MRPHQKLVSICTSFTGEAIQVTKTLLDSSKILSRAKAVEAAVYTASRRTDQTYKTKIRSLYLNLKDKKNPNLRRRVINGDISPERLSTMTSQEMASEERRAEDQKLEEENMREAMKPTAVRSTTDQFPCGKCGKRTVAYSQAQTRSADEPMTTFCECVCISISSPQPVFCCSRSFVTLDSTWGLEFIFK